MNIGERNQIQGKDHNKQFNLYERLQDAVCDQMGVRCTIKVKEHCVSVRTKDNSFTDFVLARSVISKRTGLPVVHDKDVFGLKEA